MNAWNVLQNQSLTGKRGPVLFGECNFGDSVYVLTAGSFFKHYSARWSQDMLVSLLFCKVLQTLCIEESSTHWT